MASRRSPSPFSSRNCRNSESDSTTRKSFNGNPFASRPNALINPKSSYPSAPANTPTATDHTKRNLINRQSISSMFQDGKENHKDPNQSPARIASRNFMAPTISAAKKFTPSPRNKILGEKNDVKRASIQFLDKDSEFKSDALISDSHESNIAEQKEIVLEKPCFPPKTLPIVVPSDSDLHLPPKTLPIVVPSDSDLHLPPYDAKNDLTSSNALPETLSAVTDVSVVTEDSDVSIVAPSDSESNLPPYDGKKNFLSPRPRFLRYKPNPRIESFLNKDGNGDFGEDGVSKLEASFNLSDNSSESEVEEQDKEAVNLSENSSESEVVEEQEQDTKSCDNSVHGSSEMIVEEVENASKPRVFTGTKMIWFVFLLFMVACFSVSLTNSPPMEFQFYEDVGFAEIYQESLRFAKFARESFDDLVENVKQWSMEFFPTHNMRSLEFLNLTSSPLQEELLFSRQIEADYIKEVEEFGEELENLEEVEEDYDFEEMDVDDESDVVNEVVIEEEQINEQIQTDVADDYVSVIESSEAIDDEAEAQSKMVENDYKTDSSFADDSNGESGTLGSVSNKSLATTSFVACFSMVILIMAAFYIYRKKSNALKSGLSSNVQKGYRKKDSNNRRESSASSASDFSMDSSSLGSFTTLQRIPIKHKDEVMVTPIRRSSRLLKNRVVS